MSDTAQQTRYQSVVPYLIGPAALATIQFLTEVLDGQEIQRHMTPDGYIQHAEVQVGDSVVMLAEAVGEAVAMPTTLQVLVEDVDAAYTRALHAGATALRPPADQPYGHRNAGVRDATGNRWWLSAPIARNDRSQARVDHGD